MKKFVSTIVCIFLCAVFLIGCGEIDYAYEKYDDVVSQSEEIFTDITEVNDETENLHVEENITSFEKDELNIYFLYVGQADSFIVDCNGEYALIDCGNSADGPMIYNYLTELGITELKYLIISHPHEDHMGGASYIIKNIEIENCIMPERTVNTKIYEKMIDALLEKDVNTIFPEPKETYDLGGGTFTILACDDDADDINATSVVTLFSYGETDVLFTGDATTDVESEILEWYQFEDVEVLKVPHHGSKTSNSMKYLEAVDPETIIISVGIDNTYGLPKSEILSRLESLDAVMYRTDLQGTIIMTGNKNDYSIFVDGSNYDGDSDGSANFAGLDSNGSSSSNNCSKEEAKFCGSISGSKYHELDCSYACKINEENIIYFKTEDDAKTLGYEPCSHCIK